MLWDGVPYEKGRGYKQFKRWEWFMEQRVYPSGEFDPEAAWKEGEKLSKMGSTEGPLKSANPWMPLGPTDWVNGSGWNAGNGRINVIAEQPGNSNVAYIGAASGGLWKTTNGGNTWTNLTDNQAVLGVSGIAIDYNNTDIVYLGTGDGDGFNTYSVGVLKSTDGGNTWNTTGLNWTIYQARVIRRLLMHPTNPNILFAAANTGLYRTTDGGTTWTQVQNIDADDVEFHPTNSNIVYSCSNEFYRSTDGGVNFSPVTSGLPAFFNINRFKIAVSPHQPNWVYVLGGKSSDSTFEGIYRSTDSGVNFSVRTNTPNMFGYASDGSDDAGQSWYDMALAVNPSNADEVFIGGINVWKSTNGGSSFTINTQWTFPNPIGYVHADIHELVFFGNRIYCGSDGGIYKSDNNGGTWVNMTAGLSITQFYDIGITPQNPNLILGGTQDNGTNRYNGTPTWTHVLGADGMMAIIDPTNTNIMYGAIQNGNINKSVNGGNSFFPIINPDDFPGQDGAWVTPYALGFNSASTIFVGYRNIYRSANGGTTWSSLGNAGNNDVTNNLELAPSDSSVIYITKGNSIYKTINGGTTWTDITTGLPNLFITDIAIDPANANRLWISFSGYTAGSKIFQSVNGGTSWTNVSSNLPNLPANCITYHPGSNDVLYVGMDVGIYTKDAAATDWTPSVNSLPNVIINEIEINTVANKLYAGSFGRGVWVMDLSAGVALSNPSACQVNLAIPDNSCGASNNFPINVVSAPGTTLGTNVYLKEVKLIVAHTWTGDLDMHLIAPNGSIVELSTDNGGSGDHYGNPGDTTCTSVTRFTMSATTPITAGAAPFVGDFIPEGDLHALTGPAIGLWALRLCDDEPTDEGTLRFVELVFAPMLTNPSVCGTNHVIPDNACGEGNRFAVRVADVPGTQLGTDLKLKEVKLIAAHAWTADLDIHLLSPSGVMVELSTDNGGSGDHYGDPNDPTCTSVTRFTMSAATSITAGVAPFIGDFLPEGSFSTFNDGSNPNGWWILQVCDDEAPDQGTLRFVELVFEKLCAPNLTVNANPVPAGNYLSQGQLLSFLSTIANGSFVHFISDTAVLLQNDFDVMPGGTFEISIQNCPTPLTGEPVEEEK